MWGDDHPECEVSESHFRYTAAEAITGVTRLDPIRGG